MKRHEAREAAFKVAFSKSINGEELSDIYDGMDDLVPELDDFSQQLLKVTFSNVDDIDELIAKNLVGWTLSRIPKVSLALLRISAAQLLYMPDIPDSVVINEAVELAKTYGADDEYAFVNGALRGILSTISAAKA